MKLGRRIYNIIRSILVTAILAVTTVYVVLYLVMSVPAIQGRMRQVGSNELSKLLGTGVSIGDMNITPFNQLVLYDVVVPGENGDTILKADKIGVGFSVFNLIARHRFVFTYAELIGLDGRLNRVDAESPLNIQFIIDALSPKQKNKPPAQYDLNIRNIVIRRSRFSYDVLSADTLGHGRFDPNHIKITDIRADVSLPRIKNNDYDVELKRLSFGESSGLLVKNLAFDAVVNDTCIRLGKVKIELPNTLIAPEDIVLNINGLNNLAQDMPNIVFDVSAVNNYVTPADLSVFSPALAHLDFPVNFTFAVGGTLENIDISAFELRSKAPRLGVGFKGKVANVSKPDSLSVEISNLRLSVDAEAAAPILSHMTGMSEQASGIIANCGNLGLTGNIRGSLNFVGFDGTVTTSVGDVALDGIFSIPGKNRHGVYKGNVETEYFNVGQLLAKGDAIGSLSCDIDVDVKERQTALGGNINGKIGYIDIKGYRYNNVAANVSIDNKTVSGILNVDDENGTLHVAGTALIDGKDTAADIIVSAKDIELSKLNLTDKFPGKKLSFDLDTFFAGNDLDDITGNLSCRNLSFCDSINNGIHLSSFVIEVDNSSHPKVINVKSDIINGNISGQYSVYRLAQSVQKMLAGPFPALFGSGGYAEEGMARANKANVGKGLNGRRYAEDDGLPNNLYFNFVVDEVDEVADMFNLPVRPLSAVTVEGFVTDSNHSMYLLVDAPYLQQKNKLIEGTRLQVSLNGADNSLQVDAGSVIPLKKGKMSLGILANGANNRIDSNVSWIVDNKESYSGEVNISSLLLRDTTDNALAAKIDINPSELLFNDTAWVVHPARISVGGKRVVVDDILVTCEKQFLKIDGAAGSLPDDELVVELNDINLDYVFETLAIDNVTFGGRATGVFYASDLFSGIPQMYTRGLSVESLSYNHAVFGDAKILSSWENDDKCVTIQADVVQDNGERTKIDGKIFIAKDSLYFDFKPKRVNIAFLKPFMSAFSSDIQGEASGHAILYGTFKNINLMGDVFADSLRMKLDYTNVYYTARDSVKMRPGIISMDNIELRDPMGNTAYLSGTVTHDYFHDASFNFKLSDVHNFLCFDVNQKMSPEWYGRIFGNGSAFIEGSPGYVDINVNMTTADNSSFTFVLSDSKVATEYDFITFVDRNKKGLGDGDTSAIHPEKVRDFLKQQQKVESGSPSLFNINLMIEATPQAQMNLIMDPTGGDKLRATGNGNLRIGYNSADEEMTMFGTYTLAKGNYNFTLQDIIIKDFTIREGSSITFNGDPLSAVMNIEALYSLHANLTELDESFATDGDLNRTNVPVNALLRLQGDISAPEISFGLEFPTLTSDVYRKVMSIISTEDMMNRQIIYLLALNSFYTPDYMADGSRSNELASVASSTISSQLSNLLGQMSDNWSISPNFRSENGDFSDIEVELALSSQLLNNRLLFNGNFGYRDNALNTRNSNFIGDFDIEYLLTKSGNIRLKAYNHYNDQNYYVRSALTTQGVGVVFKHDFDDIYDFLGRKKPRKVAGNAGAAPADSVTDESAPVRERIKDL